MPIQFSARPTAAVRRPARATGVLLRRRTGATSSLGAPGIRVRARVAAVAASKTMISVIAAGGPHHPVITRAKPPPSAGPSMVPVELAPASRPLCSGGVTRNAKASAVARSHPLCTAITAPHPNRVVAPSLLGVRPTPAGPHLGRPELAVGTRLLGRQRHPAPEPGTRPAHTTGARPNTAISRSEPPLARTSTGSAAPTKSTPITPPR
jgi:hypothetical protein